MAPAMLTTSRLILRQWRDSDVAPFVLLNADPRVMAHFPKLLSEAETRAAIGRWSDRIAARGWGLWAVEHRISGDLVGMVGLNDVPDTMPFAPATEIGWRLAFDYWGQGLAQEAAEAALDYGFATLQLAEVVAFTAARNTRSEALMQRLGMVNAHADFDHPALDADSPLRRHVLYRKARSWGSSG
ncbi:GNAT family N-acetyltransferase [Chitinibacteraceae bacterium HSL-7]